MKIFLCQNRSEKEYVPVGVPYAQLALASFIEDVADVHLSGYSSTGKFPTTDEVFAKVKEIEPDVVGITINFAFWASANVELARRIKEWNPDITVIAGGHHATFSAPELLKTGWFDAIFRGEGELSLREFMLKKDYRKVPGVMYLEGSELKNTGPTKLVSLEDIKSPAYRLLPKGGMTLGLGIESSRGCPFKCDFCELRHFFGGGPMRKMSPRHFVDIFKIAIENVGISCFILLDDCFTADMKGHVKPICQLMIAEQLPVQLVFTARLDNLYKNLDLLPLVYKAGFNVAFIGVEAIYDQTLKEMNKKGGYGKKEISTVVNALKDNGIVPFVSLVFGYPNETPEMVMKTMDYVISLEAPAALINVATPYPGSDLNKRIVEQNGLLTTNYDLFDGIHRVWKDIPETTPKAVADARRNYFLRPQFIQKTLNSCIDSIDIRSFIGGGMFISDVIHQERSRPRNAAEWIRLIEGNKLVLHDRFVPTFDYNCLLRIKVAASSIYLTIKNGQIEELSDKEQPCDISLEADEQTLIDLLVMDSLDVLSALILKKVQISPLEMEKTLEFIDWFTRVQDTLRWIMIAKMNVPVLRQRLQDEISKDQNLREYFNRIFPGKSSLFIGNKTLGGLMLHFSGSKILEILLTRNYPSGHNFEKIIDIPQFEAILFGGYERLVEILMNKNYNCISIPRSVSLTEPDEFFESLPAKFTAEHAKDLNIIVHYTIQKEKEESEDNWWISIKNNHLDLGRGVHGSLPHVTIVIKEGDFKKLINGYINAMELYANGNITYRGAPFVMIQFARCFNDLYGVPDVEQINSQMRQ
jgi:anaerobic magnesium-protoporphyrin IX monomethyl ester cyclase